MEAREGERLLSLAWKEAAADLSIEVVTPYIFHWENRHYEYPVLIRYFGNNKGTLLVLWSHEREKNLLKLEKRQVSS